MGKYVVICSGEDGDVSVYILTLEEVDNWLNDEGGFCPPWKTNRWYPGEEMGTMIVRGEIIEPIQKAIAWRLP